MARLLYGEAEMTLTHATVMKAIEHYLNCRGFTAGIEVDVVELKRTKRWEGFAYTVTVVDRAEQRQLAKATEREIESKVGAA